MTPVTVDLSRAGEDAQGQAAILATLPKSFRVVKRDADVVVLSGRAAAAVPPATRAVFVVAPALLGSNVWQALAALGRPVVAGSRVMGRLRTDGVVALGGDAPSDIVTITVEVSRAGGGELREALFEAVRLLRELGDPVDALRVRLATAAAVAAEGRLVSGGRVRLSAKTGLRDILLMSSVSRTVRQEAAIDWSAPARPAIAIRHDADGSRSDPPSYHNGYRAAWLLLHDSLTGTRPFAPSTIARDLEVLTAAY